MTILNQSNRETVDRELVSLSTKFVLRNLRLISGTVFFSNRTVFRTEVQSELAVTARGEYYIDYNTGIVRVFLMPHKGDFVRYQYSKYPFNALASPVILHDINNDNFKIKMFNQVLQDDGTMINGLPTEIGVDIINELMLASPMYWGV